MSALPEAIARLHAAFPVDDQENAPDRAQADLLHFHNLTYGDVRAILAALSAPYVPGMVEVPSEEWMAQGDPIGCAIVTTFPAEYGPGVAAESRRYFQAVSR